jgi:hypothetical protein
MPSNLPSESAQPKAVRDFGIGPYDAALSDSLHGEDDEGQTPPKTSLPDGGGSTATPPELLISYPSNSSPRSSSAFVPGDYDRPSSSPRDDRKRGVYLSQSKLPDGGDAAARSDYYDHMTTGQSGEYPAGQSKDDIWPSEDQGAYASEEKESLPSPNKNDFSHGNTLESLGNFWSGYETEDLSQLTGAPNSPDLYYEKTNEPNSGGTIVSNVKPFHLNSVLSSYVKDEISLGETIDQLDIYLKNADKVKSNLVVSKTATDLDTSGKLASEVLKEYGKKDLTRRQILEYLQKNNLGHKQFLASDIIRCLKHRHEVYVQDNMDTFPIAKNAGENTLKGIHAQIVNLHISHSIVPEASETLLKCSARIAKLMALVEKSENQNG